MQRTACGDYKPQNTQNTQKKDCLCKGLHVDFPLATPCGQQLIAARWRFQRPTITARPLRTACG